MCYGDDVFVLWDADRVETDVILRAGLLLAKALCVKLTKDKEAEVFSPVICQAFESFVNLGGLTATSR